ncbi:restriction endonuclease [Peribacillus sp. NPDC097197]|uniref:restriction endonuclease n=1 Tax=Peribacillus sp. NPDC097197 TaxID=3390615 RepID=UPI003D0659C1
MLDFTELSIDGTDLERLVREIFVREGFETHWTGKGPDGGRDLLIVEKVQGPLSNFERTWLVQCKHKAHSGRSVGREESYSLVTDCKSANADGYLLVCTTALTTGLINTYRELQSNGEIVIDYWDEVKIEDRLLKPCNFSLINQFFPRSSSKVGWKIYNTHLTSFWTAHYKRAFLYLSSRLSVHFKTVSYISSIYNCVQAVYKELELNVKGIDMQLRAVYYDDKYTNYIAFVDFFADKKDVRENPFELSDLKRDIEEALRNELVHYMVTLDEGEGLSLTWDVKVYFVRGYSDDGFDSHGKEYYTPYIDNFRYGYSRE